MGATCFVQPLDLVKNRMQVMKVAEGAAKPSSISVLMGVVRNEGVTKLYNGLSAGLLRQVKTSETLVLRDTLERRQNCFFISRGEIISKFRSEV